MSGGLGQEEAGAADGGRERGMEASSGVAIRGLYNFNKPFQIMLVKQQTVKSW